MSSQVRRLLDDSICKSKCSSSDCDDICVSYCSFNCSYKPLPPPPTHHTKKFLITGLVLSSAFFIFFGCLIYYRFYSRSRIRRGRRSESQDQRNETTHQQFLDEDHGPVLDHPIWYIHTVGLQPSVINSIAVCKYKRGDGLIEGTDCSVCLSEFEEDEMLRLLPKCSHAFHIPCIDTWLRSHTNCPVCRAPIVANSAGATSAEGNSETMSSGEEAQIRVSEIDRESGRELEDADGEMRVGIEEEMELQDENVRERDEVLNGEGEEGMQPLRRSVSLDSLSAFKISQALANVCRRESDRTSSTGLVKETASNSSMQIVPKKAGSNQSLLKFMASSSIARSLQIGPSSLKRSFSCGGKLFLSRYNRNSNSILPL